MTSPGNANDIVVKIRVFTRILFQQVERVRARPSCQESPTGVLEASVNVGYEKPTRELALIIGTKRCGTVVTQAEQNLRRITRYQAGKAAHGLGLSNRWAEEAWSLDAIPARHPTRCSSRDRRKVDRLVNDFEGATQQVAIETLKFLHLFLVEDRFLLELFLGCLGAVSLRDLGLPKGLKDRPRGFRVALAKIGTLWSIDPGILLLSFRV
mmetsp:Transcript_145917/g.379327  ORF Transcript_145917/g.379327 Transcript_145917/m.379327 type:complete len:210 (-) Transcript_145917:754-1383(-)